MKIVVRFWIGSALLSIVAVASLENSLNHDVIQ